VTGDPETNDRFGATGSVGSSAGFWPEPDGLTRPKVTYDLREPAT